MIAGVVYHPYHPFVIANDVDVKFIQFECVSTIITIFSNNENSLPIMGVLD